VFVMLWLTWRQHRTQALVTAVLLAALGGVLLVHGLGTAEVAAGFAPGSAELERALGARYQPVYQVLSWLPWVAALVGLFWGAPVLAREFERGTHRLTWTQTVPRRRWLATKLGGLGLLVAAAGLAMAGIVGAWQSTFEGTRYAGDNSLFTVSGVSAAGWWVFAFALGTMTGALLRRMLPAMAVTVALFLVAFIGFTFIRYYYAPPERVELTASADNNPAAEGSYGARYEWEDPDGRVLSPGAQLAAADRLCAGADDEGRSCLYDNGYRSVVYFQPLSRYWRFQLTETGLLLVVSLALGALAARSVTRRP
jgi:hypothetical protein